MTEPSPMRTLDTSYGADYWDSLDGGLGYQDSTMWEDLAHIVKETVAIHPERGDIAGSFAVLDVGCAHGYMVRHLRRRGFDAWGVDASAYALDHAPEDTKTYLRAFDLTEHHDTVFGRQCFDLVTCFETLEHIAPEHADQAIEHLVRVLKPGGLVIATICVKGQPGWDSDPTHVNVVEHGWWDMRFARAGFGFREDLRQKLRRYWLFSQHHGVFALSR